MDIDMFRMVYADIETGMPVWHNVHGTHGTIVEINYEDITVEWADGQRENFDLAYIDAYMPLSFDSKY